MSFLESVALGIVQGVTEFLPISSDGHLALVTQILGREPNLSFVIFLHGATLLAIYAYFMRDILRLIAAWLPRDWDGSRDERRIGLLIVAGTVVTGVVALALEPVVEPMSGSPVWVGVWFLGTALVLALAEILAPRTAGRPAERLSFGRMAFIGLMQGLAVLPGLSRSGTTISGGMMAGLRREEAARFSFLLGTPIITAATLKDLLDIVSGSASLPPAAVSTAGFVAAGVSGYVAVAFLLRLVKTKTLYGFAAYTAVLGVILLSTTLL